MSKSQKNIDDLFRNKLENFEHTPDPALWNNIQKQLPKKKSKKVIPLWVWPVGIAASFVLIMALHTYLDTKTGINNTVVNYNNNNEFCPEDVITATKNDELTIKKDTVQTEQFVVNEKSVEIPEGNFEDVISSKPKKTPKVLKALAVKKAKTQNKNKKVFLGASIKNENNNSLGTEKLSPTVIDDKLKNAISANNNQHNYLENKNSGIKRILKSKVQENKVDDKESIIKEMIGLNENEAPIAPQESKENRRQESSKKWSIQPQIAPLLYNSISGNSSIEATFENEVQTIEPGISYGLKIAYQITPKWSIRAGINTANVDIVTRQLTTNTSFFSGAISSVNFDDFENESSVPLEDFEPVPTNDSSQESPEVFNPDSDMPIPPIAFIPPTRQPTVNESPEISEDFPLPTTPENSTTEVVIRQQISYVEIPLELSYQLLDKRLGTSIIGGLSTFILSQNSTEVLFEGVGRRTITGTSENLNTTSFSGNFGIGFDYAVTENIQVSVEPIVKFQFNAFDASTNFNPYIFGVYSGIKFRL